MREISITQLPQKRGGGDLEKTLKGLEASLVQAFKKISPPVVNNPAPVVEVNSTHERCSYRIEVERDGHGRIKAMVVNPV